MPWLKKPHRLKGCFSQPNVRGRMGKVLKSF